MTARDLESGRARRRTSSRSGSDGACVDVATLPGKVAVRDGRNPAAGTLLLTPGGGGPFITRIKADELPRPPSRPSAAGTAVGEPFAFPGGRP